METPIPMELIFVTLSRNIYMPRIPGAKKKNIYDFNNLQYTIPNFFITSDFSPNATVLH